MAYEQRDNSGTSFKNQFKDSDNKPDYKGSAMIDGVMYEIASWIKPTRNGGKFLSHSFKPKAEQQPQEPQAATPQSPFNQDDLPF